MSSEVTCCCVVGCAWGVFMAGLAVVVILLALALLVMAVLGLVRGRVGWLRIRSRRQAALALAGSFALLIAGGALAPAVPKPRPAAGSALPRAAPTSQPVPTPPATTTSRAQTLPPSTTLAPPPPPPPPPPPQAATCGAPANPDGYNFCGRGGLIYNFPADFCNYFNCIPNYPNGTGYVDECSDGTYSHSGGRPGACSHHGGETRPVNSGP